MAAPRSKKDKAKAASRARLRLDDSLFDFRDYTPRDKKTKAHVKGAPVDERLTPNFAVQETATTFFGRSPDWLRWRYRADDPKRSKVRFPNGYFVLDDEVLDPKTTPSGARYYTLADIEKMAYALHDNAVLDGTQLACVLNIIYANAYLHEIIAEPIIIPIPEEPDTDATS
jgi:hypothetical protein